MKNFNVTVLYFDGPPVGQNPRVPLEWKIKFFGTWDNVTETARILFNQNMPGFERAGIVVTMATD